MQMELQVDARGPPCGSRPGASPGPGSNPGPAMDGGDNRFITPRHPFLEQAGIDMNKDLAYQLEQPEGGVPIKMWTRGVPVEDEAKRQLSNAARLPVVFRHIAAMPDVHVGIGATVGSVIPTLKAIIPAAVGVDIGCGMMATQLSLISSDLDEKALGKVFNQISRDVPVGFGQHNDRDVRDHA